MLLGKYCQSTWQNAICSWAEVHIALFPHEASLQCMSQAKMSVRPSKFDLENVGFNFLISTKPCEILGVILNSLSLKFHK